MLLRTVDEEVNISEPCAACWESERWTRRRRISIETMSDRQPATSGTESSDTTRHWNEVWTDKEIDGVSWYQESAEP